MHSVFLLGGMAVLLSIATYLAWGITGVIFSFVAVALIATLAPTVPPQVIMRLYRAVQLPVDDSQLNRIVDELARRAGLKKRPTIHVFPSATLNAFAAGGENNAVIALSEGLLRTLTLRELTGVLAHEMSHIRNQDLWVMGLADIITRLVQPLAYVAVLLAILNLLGSFSGEPPVSWLGILLLYFIPALLSLLQLALSRTREFDADLEAAKLTGDPMGLAAALRKVDNATGHFWEDIMLPVPARRVPVPSILRTHPDTETRVQRLISLDRRGEYPAIVLVEEPSVSVVSFGPSQLRPRYRFPGLWF